MELDVLYQESRQRITSLLADADCSVPVPTCPGWTVHDVIAHLLGVADDALAGRLTGPPSEEQTAEEVARDRDVPTAALLEQWEPLAEGFAPLVAQFRVWPGVIDVVSHEHDIRGALGRPGDRDSDGVRVCAGAVLRGWQPPVAVRVAMDGSSVVAGAGDPALGLETTPFELLRARMGRRSRAQLAALAWTGDPAPVLDHFVVFGPAASDVIE